LFVSKGITVQDEVGERHPTPSAAVDAGWKDAKEGLTPQSSALARPSFFKFHSANFQSAAHLLKSLTSSNQIHNRDEWK